MGSSPPPKRQPGNILPDQPAQFVSMLDAPRHAVSLITAKNNQRREAKRIRSLSEFQAIVECMFRRENRYDPRSVCFRSEIDRHMTKVRLFAATDRAIRHEDEPSKRSHFPH